MTEQDLSLQPSDGVAFIVETKDNLDLATLRTQLLHFSRTEGNCEVEKLFESENSDLARFAIVRFPSADSAISVSPFDLVYQLTDETNIASVMPFFLQEPSVDLGEIHPDFAEKYNDICWTKDRYPEDHGWHLKQMRVYEAWELSKGKGVLIGHIDSGVTEHQEIKDSFKIELGKNFVEKYKQPWDVLHKRQSLMLKSGHGTATCSLAVANRKDKDTQNFRGTAPEAHIVPYRVFHSLPIVSMCNAHNIAKAIEAASQTCQVISMSFGGLQRFRCIEKAIEEATKRGIICVAAAGNVVIGNLSVTYPGWDKNCIAVAGTTPDATKWEGSCRGKSVAISAPATAVYCARRNYIDDPLDLVKAGCGGTSYPTACVAGIAALWLSHHGRDNLVNKFGVENLTRAFKTMLRKTAYCPSNWDTDNFGAGIINAAALLTESLPSRQNLIADTAEVFESFEAQVCHALRERGVAPEKEESIDNEFIQRYGNEILFLHPYRVKESEFPNKTPLMSLELKSALAKMNR